MKTKNVFNARALSFLLIIAVALFTSCQKNVNDEPVAATSSSDMYAAAWRTDKATVATDWYSLQLRMVLQANPALPNVAVSHLFAYSGISLFEAARFEMHNSRSLHGELNELPVMPLPETGKNIRGL